jgi:hypothetical protein
MTYHWGCTKSNTTGVTSGAEIQIVVVRQCLSYYSCYNQGDNSLTITGDSLSYHNNMNVCSTSYTCRATRATAPVISH